MYLLFTTKTFYILFTTKTFYLLLTTKTFYFSKTTAATYVRTHSQRSKPVCHQHSCTYTEHTLARVSHSASNSQMPGVGARDTRSSNHSDRHFGPCVGVKNKNSHFEKNIESLVKLKFDLGFPVIEEDLSQILFLISSQFHSNII